MGAASTLFWIALGVLALAAGLRVRARLAERRDEEAPRVGDEDVRRILEEGRYTAPDPEPLDQERIDEEERRFWEEDWDEPEPW